MSRQNKRDEVTCPHPQPACDHSLVWVLYMMRRSAVALSVGRAGLFELSLPTYLLPTVISLQDLLLQPLPPTSQPDLKERLIGGLLLASLIHVWVFGVIVVPLATYKLLAQVGLTGGRGDGGRVRSWCLGVFAFS